MTALARRAGDALPSMPPSTGFGALLRHYRLRRGLSQNRLAPMAGLNASYINRIESGDRRAPTEQVCVALGRALVLTLPEMDNLLLAAGYAPFWLRVAGPGDTTVAALAAVLTDDSLDPGVIADFRAIVEAMAARFRQAGTVPAAPRALRGAR